MAWSKCCVPSCTYNNRKRRMNGDSRAFFKILHPDISLTKEENAHRLALHRAILSFHVGGVDDAVASQLRAEKATICDAHFHPEDIIKRGSKKILKMGAIPILDPPAKLTAPKGKVNHGSLADIWDSVDKLHSELKDDWVFYTKGLGLIIELQLRGYIIPKIRLEFDQNASLCQASFYGWSVPTSLVTVQSVQFRTLKSYLREMESVNICQGLSKKVLKWNMHPICEWDGEKVTYTEIARSPECLVIVGFGGVKYISCDKCIEYEECSEAEMGDEEVCSAYGCNKRYKGSSSPRSDSEGSSDEESMEKRKHPRTFYEFPNDLYLKRKWVVNIRRKDWYPIDSSRICSDHFKEEDLLRNQGCVNLWPSAVPTRFKGFKKAKKVSEPCTPEIKTESKFEPDTLDLAGTISIPTIDDGSESPLTDNEEIFMEKHSTVAGVEHSAPTRLDNGLAPKKEVKPITIEETPSTVCLRSVAHDHNYTIPTCPKVMRKKIVSQAWRIQNLQRSSLRARLRYRKLKIQLMWSGKHLVA